MAQSTRTRLAALPDEPWGWKLKRARERHARLSLDRVAEKLARYKVVDPSAI